MQRNEKGEVRLEEEKSSKSKSSSRLKGGYLKTHNNRIVETEQNSDPKSNSLFVLSTLGRLKEKHLLLNDRVVLHHAERTVHTGPDHRAVVARHGHGDQPDGNGTGLRFLGHLGRRLGLLGRVVAPKQFRGRS